MAGWNAFSNMGAATTTNTISPALMPRKPSSLLQCMDTDQNGNLQIDAFRYIEFSRQRRMEFMKRANFICSMNSTLQGNNSNTNTTGNALGNVNGPPLPMGGGGPRRVPAGPMMPPGMWNLGNNNGTSYNNIRPPMLPSMVPTNTAPLSTAAAMNRAYQQQPSLAAAMAQRIVEDRRGGFDPMGNSSTNALLVKQKLAAWEQMQRLHREQQRQRELLRVVGGSKTTRPQQLLPPPQALDQQRRMEEFEAAEALLFSRFSNGPSANAPTDGVMVDKRNDGSSSDDGEQRDGTADSVDAAVSSSKNTNDKTSKKTNKKKSLTSNSKTPPTKKKTVVKASLKTEKKSTKDDEDVQKPRKKRAKKE